MICIRSSKNRNKSVFILFLLFFSLFYAKPNHLWLFRNDSGMFRTRYIDVGGVLRTRVGSLSPSLTSLRDIEFCRFCRNGPILDTAEMYTCTQTFARVCIYKRSLY